jgi:replicative DNA helicase
MTPKEVEMKTIAHICQYEDDMQMLLSEGISESFFIYSENNEGPLFRALFKNCIEYYIKFNRLLSEGALEEKIKEKSTPKSRRLLSLLRQCLVENIDHNSFPMVLKNLRKNKIKNVISEIVSNVTENIDNDGPLLAFEKMKESIISSENEIIYNRSSSNETYIFNQEYKNIINEYMDKKNNPEKYKGLEVGLSPIDNATNGFKPSTLNIVVGASGTGKSIILLNMASEIYKRCHNVIFFSLEMPKEQLKTRYICRELCVDYNKYYNAKLSPEEEERVFNGLENMFSSGSHSSTFKNDKYLIFDINHDNPGIEYIEEVVRRYQKLYGKPDAVFVDYLNNMRDREISKNRGSLWEHSGASAAGLRKLAANYNLTVFTAQQINRSGLQKGRKSMTDSPEDFQFHQEDISSSQNAVHDSDSIIGFLPDIPNRKMYIKLVKGRDFFFKPFSVNFYPEMTRIVDPKYDDTLFNLGPIEAQLYMNQQLLLNQDESMIDEFGEIDGG